MASRSVEIGLSTDGGEGALFQVLNVDLIELVCNPVAVESDSPECVDLAIVIDESYSRGPLFSISVIDVDRVTASPDEQVGDAWSLVTVENGS